MYFSYDFENCVLFLVLEKMNNTSLSGLDTNDITKKKKKVATDTNSWSWKARKNIGFGYCIPHLSDLHRYKVIEASLSTAKVNQSGNWFCNNPHSINLVKTELKNHPLSKKKKESSLTANLRKPENRSQSHILPWHKLKPYDPFTIADVQ